MQKNKQNWIVLEQEGHLIVMPETDIRPHAYILESQTKAEVAGIECPCNPRIIGGDQNNIYQKPLIVHNSFQEIT